MCTVGGGLPWTMGFRQGLWVLRGVPWVGFRSPLCCFLLYCWDFLCLVTAGEGPCDLAHPTSWSLKCDRHHLEAKTGVPAQSGEDRPPWRGRTPEGGSPMPPLGLGAPSASFHHRAKDCEAWGRPLQG